MSISPDKAARLLLVDDDEVFLRVAARALTRHGYDVCIAHDIDTALHSLSTETNFAIVDLQLGNASGLSLVPKLREVNPSMGILILSGYASSATIADAMRLGADNYLAKPADIDSIVAALSGRWTNQLAIS